MGVYALLRGGRGLGHWSRPRKWVGRRWTPFVLDCRNVTVYGVSRIRWGTALIRWSHLGVTHDLIPIRDYGGLSMLTRRKVADGQGEGQVSAAPMDWKPVAKLANLLAHMAMTKWEDGSPRKPGRITMETKGALWQVALYDLDACAVLRVNAPTLPEALQSANLLLESPDTLWEPAPWLAADQPRKRKK